MSQPSMHHTPVRSGQRRGLVLALFALAFAIVPRGTSARDGTCSISGAVTGTFPCEVTYALPPWSGNKERAIISLVVRDKSLPFEIGGLLPVKGLPRTGTYSAPDFAAPVGISNFFVNGGKKWGSPQWIDGYKYASGPIIGSFRLSVTGVEPDRQYQGHLHGAVEATLEPHVNGATGRIRLTGKF